MTHREFAVCLIEAVLAGDIPVERFCEDFETHYNFDWPERHGEVNLEIFEALFDVVVHFTPFPEEKETVYAGYKTEAEVLAAVGKCFEALKAQPGYQPGRANARRNL